MKRKLKKGDKVLWNDPAIRREGLDGDQINAMLSRVWAIDEVKDYGDESDDIYCISTEGSEAEVLRAELVSLRDFERFKANARVVMTTFTPDCEDNTGGYYIQLGVGFKDEGDVRYENVDDFCVHYPDDIDVPLDLDKAIALSNDYIEERREEILRNVFFEHADELTRITLADIPEGGLFRYCPEGTVYRKGSPVKESKKAVYVQSLDTSITYKDVLRQEIIPEENT